MFERATSFNQDISNWNVSNVVYTGRMFECAKSFNQNLEKWNVSKVEYMEDMFNGSGMTVLPKWYNG